MDNARGSVPAQRRTTLVAFLVLLSAVLVLTVLMVVPYMLAVLMGGILAVLSQPVVQWLTRHHVPTRVAAALVVLGMVLVLMAPLAFVVTKQQFPLLVLSPQMSASRNEFWVVWPSILL